MFAWQATVQNEKGDTVFNPVVTVYLEDGTTLADIYSEDGTALDNPITGTPEGFVQFWADSGEYKIRGASGADKTEVWVVNLGGQVVFKDAAGFFSARVLPVGQRVTSKDGLAWDIVASGAGDFNHPVTGQGVRVVIGNIGRLDVEQLGVDMTGVNDAYAIMQSALEKGLKFSAGPGTIYLSQPLKPTRSNPTLSLHGAAKAPRSETDLLGITQVYAPNGFSLNTDGQDPANRRTLDVSNLHIYGSGISSGVGILGSWGGVLTNSRIINYNQITNNGYAYLFNMSDCFFNRSTEGVILGDCNATRVTGNHFGSTMGRHFSSYHGQSKEAFPLTLESNNFNFSDTYSGGVWLAGQVYGFGNYFENFGSLVKTTPFVTYVARRFAFASFVWESNHMNGQGVSSIAIQVVSDNASGTVMYGSRVRGNYMRGFTLYPIKIGGITDFFDNVSGIDFGGINGNSATTSGVSYPVSIPAVRPDLAQFKYTSGGLDFSGATWVSIPFDTVVGSMNVTDVSGAKQPSLRSSRGYIATCNITYSTNVAVRNAEYRITLDGATQGTNIITIPIGVTGGNNFVNVSISQYITSPTAATAFRLQVRNGLSGAVVLSSSVILKETVNTEGFIPY